MAKALGFNLSSIVKAYFKHLVRTKRIDFSLEDNGGTPTDMTGEKLEEEMIKAGYNKAYAAEHKEAYNDMLKAKREGKLTRW